MKKVIVFIGGDAVKQCANGVQNHRYSVQIAHSFGTYHHLLSLIKTTELIDKQLN